MSLFEDECEVFTEKGFDLVVRHISGDSVVWGVMKSDLISVVKAQAVPYNYNIYSVKADKVVWDYEEGDK